ncbi:MAG: hypothetical protein WCP21_08485 [Armatimonadota bacterium]
MHDASDQAIGLRLEELEALPSVSDFSQALYMLMADLVSLTGAGGPARLALAALLDVELLYHTTMNQLVDRAEVSTADLRELADRHRVGLRGVREFATGLAPSGALPDAARWLVVAECCYHLRRTDEVVAALEQVVSLGVCQPLVQFALGYNRYMQALEDFTRPGENEGELTINNPLGFRLQCLQAVAALEDGVGDEHFDAQLYWWMGVILEAADLTEAAQDAYDKSTHLTDAEREADPQQWSGGGRWRDVDEAISEDELRQAAELFKHRFDPSDLSWNGPDERS